MKRYRLTPRALKDLDEIADYSLAAWGERQTERYLSELEEQFRWLAENPMLGRTRDDVGSGDRSFRQGLHVIFYILPDAETVAIVGVPHMSRDIETYFDGG